MAQLPQPSGGKFYAVLRRIGLADESGLRLRRCVPVLAGLCWLPLLGLTALDGTAWGDAVDIPFLYDLGAYGRFLIVLAADAAHDRADRMQDSGWSNCCCWRSPSHSPGSA